MRADYDLFTAIVVTLAFLVLADIATLVPAVVPRPCFPGEREPEHSARHRRGQMDWDGSAARYPDPGAWAFIILTLLAWFALQRCGSGVNSSSSAPESPRRGGDRPQGRPGLAGRADPLRHLLWAGLDLRRVPVRARRRQSVHRPQYRRRRRRPGRRHLTPRRPGSAHPGRARLDFIALLQNYMLLHSFTTGQRMLVVGCLVALATLGFHMLQRRRA